MTEAIRETDAENYSVKKATLLVMVMSLVVLLPLCGSDLDIPAQIKR